MEATQKNYNSNSEKNNSFFELITKISTLKEKNTSALLEAYLELSEKIVFVPVCFSYSSEKEKVNKKPLVPWKTLSLEESKTFLKKIKENLENENQNSLNLGVALRIEDLEAVALDVDDVEKFTAFVGLTLEDVLEDLKKDACVVNKSISRGYHVYVSSFLKERLLELIKLINNHELLERYGFEIKNQGLIVFPPSKFKRNDSRVYECKLIYVNPENLTKKNVESQTFTKILSLIEERRRVSEEEKKEIEEKLRAEREREALLYDESKYDELEEVIKEVKRKVRFKDLIREHLAKTYEHYETYHCPFHPPDRSPSFVVYYFSDCEIAKDYHTGEGYDVIKFYQEYHRCDFFSALKDLCKEAKIKFTEKKRKKEDEEEKEVQEQVKSFLTGGYEQFKDFFETENAFYSKAQVYSGNKMKRYAVDKVNNEIVEVLEEIKIAVKDSEFEVDVLKAREIIPIREKLELNLGTKKLYSYRALTYQNWIASFAITEGEIIRDVLNLMLTRYSLSIITNVKEKINLKDKTFEELVTSLRAEGLIANNHKIKDALSQIIASMKQAGKIKVKHEIPYAGFFLDEETGKIVCSKLQKKEVNKEDLENALLFLNYVVNEFYEHVKEKFVTVLKWFVVAPFSFIAKQKRNLIKALYLYGPAGTGKTKAAVLASQIWASYEKTEGEGKAGTAIDTVPRLGNVLSKSTFPVVINEPKAVFQKDDVKEALKNALTSTLAREKHVDAVQTVKIPALANLCFTSNHFIPLDDAILRRLNVISFSLEDRKNMKNEKDFAEALKKGETELPVIGEAITFYLHDDEIKNLVLSLNEENQFEVAEKILTILYQKAELDVPEWISLVHENEFSLEEADNEIRVMTVLQIREAVMKRILEVVGRGVLGSLDLEDKLRMLLKNNVFEFITYQENKDRVFITRKILDVLRQNGLELIHLKTLAEILQAKYSKVSFKIGGKVVCTKNIEMSFKEFYELLQLQVEEEKETESRALPETIEQLDFDLNVNREPDFDWMEKKYQEIKKEEKLNDENIPF